MPVTQLGEVFSGLIARETAAGPSNASPETRSNHFDLLPAIAPAEKDSCAAIASSFRHYDETSITITSMNPRRRGTALHFTLQAAARFDQAGSQTRILRDQFGAAITSADVTADSAGPGDHKNAPVTLSNLRSMHNAHFSSMPSVPDCGNSL